MCLYVAFLLVLLSYVATSSVRLTRQLFTARGGDEAEILAATDPATAARIDQQAPGVKGLLNFDAIRQSLLKEAPWAESHGADHNLYLGAGLLYYAYAYAFRCRTIVVLGSGGGFVPRLLKQAQRDLVASRLSPSVKFRLVLIDANFPEAGWGSPMYAQNVESEMRRQFSDIEYMFMTTDDAFEVLRQRDGFEIDYLHIDADHSHEQSFKDFRNYGQLVSPTGIISFHDTCRRAKHCHTGVPQTIDHIRQNGYMQKYSLQILDMEFLYRGIAFLVRHEGDAVIEAPKERRYHFCRNNAAKLFDSLNARVGSLSNLNDYYKCNERYNTTELLLLSQRGSAGECPHGLRRDSSKATCSKCIPGMKGENCQQYKYEQLRQQWLTERQKNNVDPPEHAYREYVERFTDSNHIQSITTIDPLVPEPKWTDPWQRTTTQGALFVRWLPCRLSDIMSNEKQVALLNINAVDAFVCWNCDQRVSFANGEALDGFVDVLLKQKLIGVSTLILEGASSSSSTLGILLERLLGSDDGAGNEWYEEMSIALSAGGRGKKAAVTTDIDDPGRQIVLLRKK
ncbi:hypothetical protein ACHAWF_018002 [Thalassiosira exigua]